MEELKNEQTDFKDIDTAAAEVISSDQEEKVSLGKFKDVNALLFAYNSLQSEFTKRCQKLKELEGQLASSDKVSPPSKSTDPAKEISHDTSPNDKDEIVKEYLRELIGKKQSAILLDGVGVGVKTPINRPKTISEAGNLARELFAKN